ncbi:MAG: M13 family peptidase, partial [Acidobacteria bacterium]|nr:M13 family peptidase [Acidobacteriota bacterium]
MRLSMALLVSILLTSTSAFPQANGASSGSMTFTTVDKSADPCADFYQYSCGSWIKSAKIPPDQGAWGTFLELAERNRETLKEILEKAAADSPHPNPIDQKIGDYYASCMDEQAADSKGLAPLKTELDRIAAVRDKQGLMDAIARVHLIAGNPLFRFYSQSDLHNANQVIAYIDQGGLTLPDRDYYIKDDAHMAEIRGGLEKYATSLFVLRGQSEEEAAGSAKTVLRIETALAKASMDRTARRDPKTRDHKMGLDEASRLASNFNLNRYFAALDAPSFSELNVANPEFFKQVNQLLDEEPLDAWKTYVTWHLLDGAAPWLSQPFVDANFKMQQALSGQKEIKPRWKRCVASVDEELGEALGERYVDLTFGAEGK